MSGIREATRTWAVCLVAASLAAPALAGPVEERCAELGSACLCSEPLRFTGNGWLHEGIDPPDSEGLGAKECAGGLTLDAEPTGMQLVSRVDNANGVDFPGPNPPSRVLKMTAGGSDGDNGWLVLGNRPSGVQNETICGRGYHRFANDLVMIDGSMRAKLAETKPSGMLVQHQIFHNGQGILDTFPGDCVGSINMQAAGRQSWLRHEFCLDVTTSSVSSRQRMVVVDTGAGADDVVSCGPYSTGTPLAFESFAIGNLFIQTEGNPAWYGSRYFTHAIQTRVPLDPDFWPGGAYELEGDVSQTDPGGSGGDGGGELGAPGRPYLIVP